MLGKEFQEDVGKDTIAAFVLYLGGIAMLTVAAFSSVEQQRTLTLIALVVHCGIVFVGAIARFDLYPNHRLWLLFCKSYDVLQCFMHKNQEKKTKTRKKNKQIR